MIKYILSICFCLCVFLPAFAQKSAKRELRGAWITTHFGLDWPTSSQTPTQQQAAMISILDQHKATGMNAIYFQVRNQCDALYPSSIEPWSSTLTGIQGKDPGWDPLQFVIAETHKRGMELHAWLNPYRAVATASQLPNFVPNHVAKQHPEWLLNNGSVITLNPGLPAVRDYIMSVINDITSRYDIDGIHFDDYFYPSAPVRDTATYNSDPRGMNQADWRRDNINIFIKRVYDEVAVLKPWVKFGVSPTGIYRSSTDPTIGSNTSTGAYQHYSAVYADTKKWIQQGWVDYLAPQVYWYIGQSGSDYGILIPWWNNQASGRHIYIGQSIYKVGASFANPTEQAAWADRTQIPRQMRMNRSETYQSVYGEIAFRTANLRSNPLNVRDSIRVKIYKKPALLPAMSWRDNTPPQSPSKLTAVKQPDYSYILNWIKPAATGNELDKVRQFVIYRSESSVININDTANILNITATDVNTYTDANPANKTYYYTITSVDRLYNESVPSNVTDYLAPTITCPEDQYIILNSTCSSTLSDYTKQATVKDDVSAPENIVVTQSPVAGSIINGTGNTAITLTATDGSGKSSSCIFNVKAEDREPPYLTVPEDTIVATDNDKCSAVVNYTISSSDNCSPVTIVSDFPSGSSFYKGITKVTVTATDESGNSTTKTFTVTVNDQQAPLITTNGDKTVYTDQGRCSASVLVSATATDNCGLVTPSGIRNDNLALSDQYPVGTTTITWTSTDADDNTTTSTQTVTVTDNINPIITCPAPVAATTNNGCTATGVSLGTPTTSDNCSVASVTNDHPSTTYPLGTTTVIWTVTDGSGNTSTCKQTVTVTDNINPIIICPAPVAATTNNGCTATGVSIGTPTTSDNCSVASVTNDHPSTTYP
ncbi:MAG: family 10 glycosylhydrolase, partial [Chitinophagaceae bacterium]|nr:family 10 glycosylhydrolase [Chitinophagaceae bacterium]